MEALVGFVCIFLKTWQSLASFQEFIEGWPTSSRLLCMQISCAVGAPSSSRLLAQGAEEASTAPLSNFS